MVGKNRLVMVLSYLESIEDPYQYGDNYGDLVEYLKMLIEGEEEYVPEENKFTLSWMQKNEGGEWETKSKLVNWEDFRGMDTVDILQSGLLGEATHVKDMRLTESPTRDSWVNKKNPFNFSPKTLKWIEDNAVEPERTKHGIIIEGSFDREDYLTEEDKAFWGLDEIVDELTKKINDTREEADLIEEEYAHAKWKKGYKNKELYREVREAIKDVEAAIAVTPEAPSIGEMMEDLAKKMKWSNWRIKHNTLQEELRKQGVYFNGKI